MTTVLILGSGPTVLQCRDWDLGGVDEVVAINNAWQVRDDWTVSIFPDDFPEDRRPQDLTPRQQLVQSDTYVPAQNRFGGVVYAGATMALTASYWVLDALRPARMLYFGCDMVYDTDGPTHFYGTGQADPLRPDPTLQSLEAKIFRLQALAAREGCAVVNLSEGPSRLPFPRGDIASSRKVVPDPGSRRAVANALELEADAGMIVPSGRYWEDEDSIDPHMLQEIDEAWLAAYGPAISRVAS